MNKKGVSPLIASILLILIVLFLFLLIRAWIGGSEEKSEFTDDSLLDEGKCIPDYYHYYCHNIEDKITSTKPISEIDLKKLYKCDYYYLRTVPCDIEPEEVIIKKDLYENCKIDEECETNYCNDENGFCIECKPFEDSCEYCFKNKCYDNNIDVNFRELCYIVLEKDYGISFDDSSCYDSNTEQGVKCICEYYVSTGGDIINEGKLSYEITEIGTERKIINFLIKKEVLEEFLDEK